MGRFLSFLILLSIALSTILTFMAGGIVPLIIFQYVNLLAGFVTVVVLFFVDGTFVSPFNPKFYYRELCFNFYGLEFSDSSFLRTTYGPKKLPLLRPESIVFYFTLLILYIPQVSNSINQKYGEPAITLLTLVLIVVYCLYTWSVLVVDLIKQNQLTLLENTILSYMKEYDFYDKNKSIDDNLNHFTSHIIDWYSVDLHTVQKPTNENVYKLDQYKKTLAIVKKKLPEDFKTFW